MTDSNLLECLNDGESRIERLRFFDTMLLTADDLKADQEYFLRKLMRHNRLCHGWGVVCGLEVVASPTDELPWRVSIGPGYALDPFGNEVYVPESVCFDLARCAGAAADPCDPGAVRGATGGEVFVAIRYAECAAQPVQTSVDGCFCDELACEYSRFRDGFQLDCLDELPPSHQQLPKPSLCDVVAGLAVEPCPPCPGEPWLVLARVSLPASLATALADAEVDNFSCRRLLFSTGALQEQLIACCCDLADLEIEKTGIPKDSGISPPIDFFIVYTIKVTNHGPADAPNVRVDDRWTLPADDSLTMTGITPQAGNWQVSQDGTSAHATIELLEARQEAVLVYSLNLTGDRNRVSEVVNSASVTSDFDDPRMFNNEDSAEIEGSANLGSEGADE